jgi:hypothetical protein
MAGSRVLTRLNRLRYLSAGGFGPSCQRVVMVNITPLLKYGTMNVYRRHGGEVPCFLYLGT